MVQSNECMIRLTRAIYSLFTWTSGSYMYYFNINTGLASNNTQPGSYCFLGNAGYFVSMGDEIPDFVFKY